MKQLGILLFASLLVLTACQEEGTTTQAPAPTETTTQDSTPVDFQATVQRAKNENKFVLLEFTGSDWCPPCKSMHKNVLTASEFKDYAKTNVIFVELDFPNSKPQSDAVKKANQALQEKFKIDAFPTFVLVNPDGAEVWREVGAFTSSPEKFIAAVEGGKKSK